MDPRIEFAGRYLAKVMLLVALFAGLSVGSSYGAATATLSEYRKPILLPASQTNAWTNVIPNALAGYFTYVPFTTADAVKLGFPTTCGNLAKGDSASTEDCYSISVKKFQQQLALPSIFGGGQGLLNEDGAPFGGITWAHGYGSGGANWTLPYYDTAKPGVVAGTKVTGNAPTPFADGSLSSSGIWHFPAPTIKGTKGRPVRVQWLNDLPNEKPTGFDPTLCEAAPNDCYPYNRIVTHVHGAHVGPESDGLAHAWFSPGFTEKGLFWESTRQHGPEGTYYYPLDTEASTIWYHDHAVGLTHNNTNMGMAGFFPITDNNEKTLQTALKLPSGDQELGFALQDRVFYNDGQVALPDAPILDANYPLINSCTYTTNPASGDITPTIPGNCSPLFMKDPANGHLIPYVNNGTNVPLLATSATLEFFGNIPVVNGVTYGKYNVDRGIYRMRFIGGTDSRTWALRLKISNSNPAKYLPFWVIGTEQGFLNNPVKSEHLLIMPGERYDVLIDFNSAESMLDDGVTSAGPVNLANKRIVVENWAGDAPYGGETILAPENPQAAAFRSSDIPEVMIFDVSNNTAATSISTPSASLSLRPGAQITNLDATVTRNVSLVEIVDNYGRIMPTLDGRGFMEFPITELPRLNATEQWDIINTTVDAHPMHLHQVAFQLINREDINVLGADPVTQEPILDVQSAQLTPPYNSASYVGSGVVTPPADYEAGWKDTVVCPPAKVTRVRAKFDIPGLYVWHCHILSHEEHDMMRPLVVTTPVTDVTLSASALSQVTGSSPAEVQLTAQSANAVTGSSTGNGFEYEFVVTRGNTVISEQPTRLPAKFNSSIGDGFNMVRVASWTPPNRSGVYTITVNAKAMGPIDADPLSPTYNPVKSATLTYTMIDVPAVVAVTSSSPAGAYNAGKSINVTVTFNQPINSTNGLVIALSSGAAISTGPLANVSSFSGSYIVAAGQNTQALNVISITGTVTDALGANPVVNPTVVFGANISNNKTIAVDTVNPALTVLAPGDGTLTNSAQITVNGVVSDLNGIQLVTVNGANVPVGAAGTFSSVVPLVTGGNSITAVATDVAGNTTTLVRSVTLDQAVPNTLITPVAGTYSGTVTVSLTSESGAKIYYTTDGQIPSTSSALYSGPFVLTASATTTYTVQYFALDAAGNSEAVKSTPFTIHVSDLANASVVINNGATVTNSASVNLTLAATDLSSPIAKMMVACDGINFAAAEPFSTSRTCTLPAGDGLKTVAVKYIDGLQTIYDPVTAQITVDTVVPVTSATPGSGVFGSSVVVALTVNKAATIYYSVDGSIPTVHSTRYLTPLTLNSSSTAPITLMYFAVDQAGNAEQVKSVTYTLHTADLSQAVVSINNGALFTMSSTVSLSLAASDPNGIPQMQVACDGINYSAAEQFNPVRTCSLSAGDGVKTIAIKFIDGLGTVYPPIPAQITLDSVAAVTTVTPVGGVYSGSTAVSFSANETAKIYYTLDGTEPVESAANLYSGEFNLTPASTTQYQVKYFSVDQAGNRETTKTITYTVHISDLTGSISINNNVPYTAVSTVTLKLFAQDPAGVQWMQFSNDGISFTPLEAYATSKVWTLNPSDGLKTVYVRYTDNNDSGYTFSANVILAAAAAVTPNGDVNGDGLVDIKDALKAMQISIGLTTPTLAELVRGDVAPFKNGIPVPDGVIDIVDVLLILRRAIGLVTW